MSDDFVQLLVPGESLLIQVPLEQSKELVKTEILEVFSSHKFIVSCPIVNGRLFLASPGERYQMIHINSESGVFAFIGLIVSRDKSDSITRLHILRVSDVKKEQRREFFRLSLVEQGSLMISCGEGEEVFIHNGEKITKIVPLFQYLDVLVKDISAGGVRVISKLPYEIGFKLAVQFELEHTKYKIEGEIVRCFLIDDVVKRYDLGIKFINIEKHLQHKLVGVIFEKQRKLLKKGLGS